MRVAVVQHDIVFEDAVATRVALDRQLAALDARGIDLVVLAEMFATGFTMRPEQQAEDADGASVAWLRHHAARLDATVVGSLPWRQPDGTFTNRLLVVAPDGGLEHYDKIHPFGYGREADHYRGGAEVLTTAVAGVRITPFVCYDLRFADLFWDVASDTDCYLVVANWPQERRAHWSALLVARAIENQAWVVGVNRVGDGGGLAYVGDSVVVDPLGRVIASASEQPQVLVADVRADEVAAVRDRLPFLADRRSR